MQKVSDMMAILQAQLKNLPAAQRRKMEQMIGGGAGNKAVKQPVKLQKTGKMGRFAGSD